MINRKNNLSAVARKSSRVIVILYVIAKQVLCMTDPNIEPYYWAHRAAASIVMLILAFIVTGKMFSNRSAAALIGPALALPEITWVAFSPPTGEWFVFIFLIGCSLMSLLYLDSKGLLFSMTFSCMFIAFFSLVLGINMSGEGTDYMYDIFGFVGLIMINILIYSIGTFIVGTFARSKRTEQIFDMLLDTTPGYMVIINEKSMVEYISHSLAEWLGISNREYVLKRPIFDLCHSNEMAAMFQEIMEDAQSSLERHYELTINDVGYWFFLRSSLMGMGGGKTVRTIELSDITPIMEAKNEAEAATKAKSNFLATMSHEIRTPLNAVIGIAQIQLQKAGLTDEYAMAFDKIHSSGNGLLGIINDILDMSKIETGKLELNPSEYDTPSLINDTVQLNIVRIGSKPIEFILDIDEDLPLRLYGDEVRLKQILNNLLSNAVKYTEKGHVKLSVQHWAEDEDITLNFTIEDSGQGMKLEDRKDFFSEYQRFNTEANRSTEGTGLGLSITKKLIEMMDGTIWVESEYGMGSIFLVTVKQKAVESPAIGAELVKQLSTFTFTGNRQASGQQITRDPMPYGSVLIVDDVETNLYVAHGLLSPYQLKIETALSGFEAIDLVGSGNTYDIIFMDHMMPQMDGVETTQKLRAGGYTGVIVALTANALVGNDEMFRQNGFDGFVSKPIDVRHLNAALNKHIRDQYPEEAKKYKPETIVQTEAVEINPKVLQIFRGDAEKAAVTLRETVASGDIKLFTTTAHAMKSALANVGEKEASALAAALEDAGLKGDTEYISSGTEDFVKTLEALIDKLKPAEDAVTADTDIEEDTDYLIQQLQLIKAACEDYDDDAAYAALDRLGEKQWKPETKDALEQIRDALFVYSDFDGAAEMAERFMERLH